MILSQHIADETILQSDWLSRTRLSQDIGFVHRGQYHFYLRTFSIKLKDNTVFFKIFWPILTILGRFSKKIFSS